MTVTDTIRGFVRGEANLDDLEQCGLAVKHEGDFFYEDHQANGSALTSVSLSDIAVGALKVLGDGGDAHWWAYVVSEASFIDFEPDDDDGESTNDGDLILTLLWDLRFRNPLTDERLERIHQLAARGA